MLNKFQLNENGRYIEIVGYSENKGHYVVVSRLNKDSYEDCECVVSEEVEKELGYSQDFEELYDSLYYQMYLYDVDMLIKCFGFKINNLSYELRSHLSSSKFISEVSFKKMVEYETNVNIVSNLVESPLMTEDLLKWKLKRTNNILLINQIESRLKEISSYGKK